MLPTHRRIPRRLSGFVLFLFVGLMLFFALRHRPVEMVVAYDLRGGREQLIGLDVSWRGEDGKAVAASFNFRKEVPQYQRHTLSLPKGDYVVTAVLRRADGRSSIVERSLRIEEEGELELDLVDEP